MRQFTAVEKQQLRSKIRDQQERRLKRGERESPNAKNWSLAIILFAIGINLIIFLKFRRFGYEQFYILVIMVIAQFDHLADHFFKQGRQRRLLKIAEWGLIILAFAYVAYLVWTRFASKLTTALWGD
ncbi:MAG: hypothetical protein OXN17_12185 [Candidatus Poribacteria bacterium]|nr:hypothetical protein [Candidatus Poribacteria bacterium]MDE0505250.1 hypothetical protein [Candidatus Poribacteria bacterium]